MVGWDHQFNGHEFEQALGDGERQGNQACCGPWGRKESDTTEQLNNKATTATTTNMALDLEKDLKCACGGGSL